MNTLLKLVFVAGVCLTVSMAQRDRVIDAREHSVAGHNKKVVCYWGTWANYRPNNGKFTPGGPSKFKTFKMAKEQKIRRIRHSNPLGPSINDVTQISRIF